MSELSIEKIIPTDEQVLCLYKLLNKRDHNISHKQRVAFENHESFVHNHPYRAWFLIKLETVILGSFYISNENTIGINIENYADENLVSAIFFYIKKNFQPLSPIASVRGGEFTINISPSNHLLSKTLKNLGAELAQKTFYLPR